MAKFAINASGAMLLPSLVQVSESISGSVVPLAMFVCMYQPDWFLYFKLASREVEMGEKQLARLKIKH